MRVLSLCGLLLLLACSSNPSTEGARQNAESKYAESLPATDLGAEPASRAQSVPVLERGYSRQVVLEKEVIANARGRDDSTTARARAPADFKTPPTPPGIPQEAMPPLDKAYTLQLAVFKQKQRIIDYAVKTPQVSSGIPQEAMPPLDKTYTLQLAAFKQRQLTIDYAERYKIDVDQAGVARIMNKGELWYILAYGVYISREDANQAKANLQARGVPEPWVRRLSTLEALSRKATRNGD